MNNPQKDEKTVYTYPDTNDSITQKMISQHGDEYARYWTHSEDSLLKEVLKSPCFPGKGYTLLDVGCGEGRLFHYFADTASLITAIEPDTQRFNSAQKTAQEIEMRNPKCRIECENDSFSSTQTRILYDVVLSSHVVQHISSREVEPHLEKLVQCTSPGGIIILHTTYSGEDKDVFVKASVRKDSGQWVEPEISQDVFDSLIRGEGVLPIHKFNLQHLIETMKKYGCELRFQHLFHADKELLEEWGLHRTDIELNHDTQLYSRGRDVSLVFQKELIIQEGSLSSFFPVAINMSGFDPETFEKKVNDIQSTLVPGSCIINNQSSSCDFHCREIAKIFHNRSLEAKPISLNIGSTEFKLATEADIRVHATFWIDFFRERNIGIFCCNMYFQDQPVNAAISLRNLFLTKHVSKEEKTGNDNHVCFFRKKRQGQPKPTTTSVCNNYFSKWEKGVPASIASFCKELTDVISELLNGSTNEKEKTAIVDSFDFQKPIECRYNILEINAIREIKCNDAAKLVRAYPKQLYGLLTGDEGFAFVPEKTAKKRLGEFSWQTRNFAYFTCFGKHSLMFNLKHQDSLYSKKQVEYVQVYEPKGENSDNRIKYFRLKSCIAGVDHGILDTIEDVLLTELEVYYLNKRFSDYQSNKYDVYALRQKLIRFVRLASSQIEEINSLRKLIIASIGLQQSLNETKHSLALITDDVSIKDQLNLNILVSGLTFATVVVGVYSIANDNTHKGIWIVAIGLIVLATFVLVRHRKSIRNKLRNLQQP